MLSYRKKSLFIIIIIEKFMFSVAIITIVKVEHIRDYVGELEDETRSNAETIAGGKSLG